MPKRSYQLINPVIEGTFQDVYEASESIDAAHNMWKNLSSHILSHVPKFMFTMRDISSGNLHHFEVSENKKKGSYTIGRMDLDIKKQHFDDFLKQVDNYSKSKELKGGKRKRYEDDSSSSSSSTDIYPTIRRTSPVALFHYNTRVYYTSQNGVVQTYESTLNPQLVAVAPVLTPIFTPVFRPSYGTFIGIWP